MTRIRMSLPEADLLLTNRTVRRPYPKSQGPLCGSSSMLMDQYSKGSQHAARVRIDNVKGWRVLGRYSATKA